MTLDTQIADFKLKRAEIEKLKAQVDNDKIALDQWVASTDICKKWIAKNEELNKKMETYKAEMKAAFGMCDGERTDVLVLIESIKKVSALD